MSVVCVRPQLTQPREVGVRVEHDELQVGLEQQPLEHDAEGIRLAGARLAAQEGVAPETARIEEERHARSKQQLAYLEPGPPRGRFLEVVAHLVGRRRPHRSVVEGRAVPAQDTAFPFRATDHDVGAVRSSIAAGHGELGPLVPAQLEGHDLAESSLEALIEHDVRAGLQPQTVERGPVGEPPPVDRRGERKDVPLQLLADGSVALDALLHVDRRLAHGPTLPRPAWRRTTPEVAHAAVSLRSSSSSRPRRSSMTSSRASMRCSAWSSVIPRSSDARATKIDVMTAMKTVTKATP